MAEYIDKQAAIIQLSHNKSRGDDEWMLAVESDMGVIRAIPAADVVPVVCCRYCKYNTSTHKCLNPNSFFLVPDDNDFCSYGERREE